MGGAPLRRVIRPGQVRPDIGLACIRSIWQLSRLAMIRFSIPPEGKCMTRRSRFMHTVWAIDSTCCPILDRAPSRGHGIPAIHLSLLVAS